MSELESKFHIANQLHAEGEYSDAIVSYRQIIGGLLKMQKTKERQFKLASVYVNLGNSYKEHHDFKNDITYFKKSLSIYKELHSPISDCRKQIAWCYNNIGSSKLIQRKFDESYNWNFKSLEIREKLFNENRELFQIDYLMSLYKISLSLQQLSKRKDYIIALKKFINEFEQLGVADDNAKNYLNDAKSRLTFATEEGYSKLKPIEEIKKELPKFIDKHKGYEPTPDQAKDIVQEFTEICGGRIFISQVRDNLEQFYLRVRRKETMKDGDELHVNQFKYPPIDYTEFGRVNLSKNPVFYGGERIEVVVKETHVKEGEQFYLSCWRSNNFYPKYVLMHNLNNDSKRMNLHSEVRKQNMTDGLKSLPNVIAESFEYITSILSELFTIDDWTISSSIGYSLLYDKDASDGIEYPDVKTKSSYNFALKPEAANKLTIMKVYLCQLINGEIEFLETGNPTKEKINYEDYKETDHPFKLEDVRIFMEEKYDR